jgi:hypothetical protein
MTLIIFLNILLQTPIDDPNKFNGYLILGYFVMWLAFIVYIIGLANKQRNTKRDVKLMQQLLQEDEEDRER